MSVNTDIRELFSRIQALEATPVFGAIRFDTHPQLGHWLYVEANDGAAGPNGYSIELVDSAAGGNGIHLSSAQHQILLDAAAGLATLTVSYAAGEGAIGGIIDGTLGSGGGAIQWRVDNDATGVVLLKVDSVFLTLDAGTPVYPQAGAHMHLASGAMFEVRDHTASPDPLGKPIFQVRDDGSVHILTGTSIVADL